MLHVPGSAGLQPSLLTMTFPPSGRPCFSHSPPPDSLFPSLNPSVLLSPHSLQPSILPPSLNPRLRHPLIHPSLSQSDWMMLTVLDPEHGKGLHKYTIHHRRQGQLKPHDTHTIDLVCVSCATTAHAHNIYRRDKQKIKWAFNRAYIHSSLEWVSMCNEKEYCASVLTNMYECVCVFPSKYYIYALWTHTKKETNCVMYSLCVHTCVLHVRVNQ